MYKLRHETQIKKNKLPNHIESISFENDFYKYTRTSNDSRFLLFDTEDEDRIICFASNEQLLILSKAQRWHEDGTFKSAPSLFYQLYLYLIHGMDLDVMHACCKLIIKCSLN